MSTRIAWAFIEMSAGRHPTWIGPDEAYRLRTRPARLRADAAPELLARSWLAARAQRVVLTCARPAELRLDPRLVLTGLSDARSATASDTDVEAYVAADNATALVAKHQLTTPAGHANVVLHVGPLLPQTPVPDLLVATDLADHDTSRELATARRLVRHALAHWPADADRPQPAQGTPLPGGTDILVPATTHTPPTPQPGAPTRRPARGLDLLIPWDAQPWEPPH